LKVDFLAAKLGALLFPLKMTNTLKIIKNNIARGSKLYENTAAITQTITTATYNMTS